MKNLVVAMAVGAAALIGGTAAQAAGKADGAPGARASQSTDISARGRHHHGYGHHHWRGYGHHRHGYYRPGYNSYGYYRTPSYGYGRPYGYYGGGPGVTFSFGSGRW